MEQEDYIYRKNREYLSIFRTGIEKGRCKPGQVWKIQALGFPNGGSMPVLSVDSSMLSRLIDPKTRCFLYEMYFDDHLFQLNKIEIVHSSRTVNIHVKSDHPEEL